MVCLAAMQAGSFVACQEGLSAIVLLHAVQTPSGIDVGLVECVHTERAELPSSLALSDAQRVDSCTSALLHVIGGPVLVGSPPWHIEAFSVKGSLSDFFEE